MEQASSLAAPSILLQQDDPLKGTSAAAWSLDGAMELALELPGHRDLLFGAAPEPEVIWEQPVRQGTSSAEATFTPMATGSGENIEAQIPASMGALISEAIRRGIAEAYNEG